MKHKLIQFSYTIYKPIRKIYWYITRPITVGVRAIILNKDDQVLLLRHTYMPGWYLPGGGADRKEILTDAIKRELHEELGMTSVKIDGFLGMYTNLSELKTDHIAVFIIKEYQMEENSNPEIAEARFFDVHDLPGDISRGSKKRVMEFLKIQEIDYRW